MIPRASIFSCPLKTQGDVFVAAVGGDQSLKKSPWRTEAEPALRPFGQKPVIIDTED